MAKTFYNMATGAANVLGKGVHLPQYDINAYEVGPQQEEEQVQLQENEHKTNEK